MIRRNPIEKKINHERWLVSYADFITLLFAFFVVMYSISAVNDEKYRELTETLGEAFSSENTLEKNARTETPLELADISEIADKLATALAGDLGTGAASISKSEEWVEIELNANVLFKSGSAVLQNEAQTVLPSVAELLKEYDNAVVVEGHTDNIPIANQEYSDNWALSAARAVSVVNSLSKNNVDPKRLSAVGMGEFRPLESNNTEEGRAKNRRVVLRVSRLATAETEAAVKQEAAQQNEQANDGAAPDEADDNNSDDNNSDDNKSDSLTENSASETDTPPAEEDDLDPVRLQGGGLLFSSDPDLPRTNPPVEEENTPPESEE